MEMQFITHSESKSTSIPGACYYLKEKMAANKQLNPTRLRGTCFVQNRTKQAPLRRSV